MKRACAVSVLLSTLFISLLFSRASVVIFGPQRFNRTTGAPNEYTVQFALPAGAASPYTMHVVNGASNGLNRVSSATIKINGSQILGPSDFNQQVGVIDRTVSLITNNVLYVHLASAPGSYLTININGQGGTTIPVLSITQPSDGFITKTSPVSIVGTVSGTTPIVVKANGSSMTVATNGVVSGQVALVEGMNTINFIATDATGGSSTVVRKVTLDSQPPIVNLTSPINGLITNQAKVTVNGTVTDASLVQVTVNGIQVSVDHHNAFNALVALAEGQNTITIVATDAAGNSTKITRMVTRDDDSPTLTLSEPANGLVTKNSSISVSGTVHDLTAVAVKVNGVVFSVDQTGAFSGTVSLREGKNMLQIVATDAAKNSTTIIRSVIRDTTPPDLDVFAPFNNITTGDSVVIVSGKVTDCTATVVNISVNGGKSTPVPLQCFGFFIQKVLLSGGTNIITITATDAAGNSTIVTRTVNRKGTTLKLVVSEPADETITRAASILVKGTVTGTGAITLKVNGTIVSVSTDGSFSASVNLVEGTNLVTITATDAANTTLTITRLVIKDTTPPILNVDTPVDGLLTKEATVAVSGTVSDSTSVDVLVNGSAVSVGIDGSFNYTLSTIEGTNVITIVATDTMGNATTITRKIRRDTTPPTLTITTPNDGAITSADSIFVTGSVKDSSAVTLKINEVPIDVNPDPVNGAGGTFSGYAPLSYEGTNQVYIVATDALGNVTTSSRLVIMDSQSPVINLTSPIDSLFTNQSNVTVSGTILDSTVVTLTVNGISAPIGENGVFSYQLQIVEGMNTITIVAADAASNQTKITRLVRRDTQSPIVNLTSPIDSLITNLQSITVGGTVTDSTAVTVTVKIGSETPSQLQVGTDGTFSYDVPIVEGMNTITIVATDAAGNQTTVVRHVIMHTILPVLIVTVPVDSVITNITQITVRGTVSSQFPVTLTVNGAPVSVGLDSTFSTQVNLQEGINTITMIATNSVGSATTVTRNVRLDTTPPMIVLTSPIDSAVTNKTKIIISGSIMDSSSVIFTINGITFPVSANGSFSDTLSINEGKNYFSIIATDAVGNQATIKRTVVRDTQAPTILIASPAMNATTTDNLISVIGSIIDSTQISVTVNDVAQTLSAGGGFNASIFLSYGSNTITFIAADQVGNTVTAIRTITRVSLPPDPKVVAPPVDTTVSTLVMDATEFLYTGANPIQQGVAPGTINKIQVTALRGRVLDRNLQPLPGAVVTILNHTEYGTTSSRSDGMYDMVVNGGGDVRLNFAKIGYLSAQRQVDARLQSYKKVNDVVLLPIDSVVHHVDLSSPQIVQGNQVNDSLGSRKPALFIKPGTTANLIFDKYTYRTLGGCSKAPDNWCPMTITVPTVLVPTLVDSLVPVNTISVRMTEYTANTNGDIAIPGVLPASVAYTFAFELSADEMASTGARDIRFTQPAVFYLENAMNFPVGLTVPFGWYDKQNGVWNTSSNGKVIKIIDTIGGRAAIDYNGDNIAEPVDTLIAKGISLLEQQYIARNYNKSQSLWRCEITHLGTFAAGFTMLGPSNAKEPQNPFPDRYAKVDKDNVVAGSVIGVQNQTLSESIPITNTGLTLNYKSDRVFGRREAFTLDIPITGPVLPDGASDITLDVAIMGRVTSYHFPVQPNLTYHFVWDGLDAYGRRVQGQQNILTTISYCYPAQYALPPDYNNCFATPTGKQMIQYIPSRNAIKKTQIWEGKIGAFDVISLGVGGWSLNLQHGYDCLGRILYKGDGQVRNANVMDNVINTVMGKNADITNWCTGNGLDGTLATENVTWDVPSMAFSNTGELHFFDGRIRKIDNIGITWTVGGLLPQPSSDLSTGVLANCSGLGSDDVTMAFGPDGCMYVAEYGKCVIWKITKYGERILYAGIPYARTYGGDGGQATQASFYNPTSISFDGNGNCYVFDGGNFRIRKIAPDGIVTTVAGSGVRGFSGDGEPATLANISGGMTPTPWGTNDYGMTAMKVGKDGTIYFCDGDEHIRKVTPDGIIHTIAGTGYPYSGNYGDGGLAINALVGWTYSLALGKDGTIFFASEQVVRGISTDGYIKTIAGGGNNQWLENCPASAYALSYYPNIAVGPDNNLYICDDYSFNSHALSHIMKVSPPLPGISLSEILIASEDGSERYVFSYGGRHLRTLDALTGVTKYTFGYNSRYKLVTITDIDSLVTRIERDSSDVAKAIISPYGVRTELNLDSLGYLLQATNPATESRQFTYTDGGLMTSMTDARSNTYHYEYDSLGYLTKDLDPVGGYTNLKRVYDSTGYTITSTTAMGKKTTYRVDKLRDGRKQFITTDPNGLKTTTVDNTDGSSYTITPDGMICPTTEKPDPRFGMQSPLENAIAQTPGGLRSNVDQSRTITQMTGNAVTGLLDTIMVNGKAFKIAYDGNARMLTKTSAEGRKTFSFFDAKGRIVKDSIPGLLATTYKFDNKGRKIEDNQGGRQTTYAYDSLGRQAKVTDPYGRSTQFFYDGGDRLTKTILPDLSEVSFTYDKNGNMLSLTPPSKPEHTFDYSKIDLETLYTPPFAGDSARATARTYTLDKEPWRILRSDSLNVTLEYGGKGSLAGVPKKIYFDRGMLTNLCDTLKGQQVGVVSAEGDTLKFVYDGTIVKKVTWSGQNSINSVKGNVSFAYNTDLQDSIEAVIPIVGSPDTVRYKYDKDGLLTSVGLMKLRYGTDNSLLMSDTVGNIINNYTYDVFGALASKEVKTGATILFRSDYVRDSLSRITEKTENVQGNITKYNYGYDVVGRLVQVKRNDTLTAEYQYDANGNRLAKITLADTARGICDAQDRLLTYSTSKYLYTQNGDLTMKVDTVTSDTTRYSYDAFGALRSVRLPNGTLIEYLIDGSGKRVGEKINGAMTQKWLYSSDLRIIAELDSLNQIVSRFVYTSSKNVPEYFVKSDTIYRIVTDHLGSVRQVVNTQTGAIVQQIDYDEFGNVLNDSNPSYSPFGFAGGLYDPRTKLVRFGARDYEAETGRWSKKDPILFISGDWNHYSYSKNDPMNQLDVEGRGPIAEKIEKEFGLSYLSWLIEQVTGQPIPISPSDVVIGFFTGDWNPMGENDVKYRSPDWYKYHQQAPQTQTPFGVADATQVTTKAPNFGVIIEDGVIKMVNRR
ncbi:MAG: Ig-like domain-containing protein [Bacteroidota bacterium]|jgi:RHS repeat-associated protein